METTEPVDRPNTWWADLPEIDDAGYRFIVANILDVLTHRDATRDDVREAFTFAASRRPAHGEQPTGR